MDAAVAVVGAFALIRFEPAAELGVHDDGHLRMEAAHVVVEGGESAAELADLLVEAILLALMRVPAVVIDGGDAETGVHLGDLREAAETVAEAADVFVADAFFGGVVLHVAIAITRELGLQRGDGVEREFASAVDAFAAFVESLEQRDLALVAVIEVARLGHGDGDFGMQERVRQLATDSHRRQQSARREGLDGAREPAAGDADVFLVGHAALHHVLRLKVAAGAVLQAASMHHGEVAAVVEFLQRTGFFVEAHIDAVEAVFEREAFKLAGLGDA